MPDEDILESQISIHRQRIKNVLRVVGIFLFFYFFGCPILWIFVKPKVTVSVPNEWQYNTDMPIHIKVRAGHKNFIIQQVRIAFEYNPSSKQKTPYPIILYSTQKRDRWSIWEINRFTLPFKKEIDVVLPLAELSNKGQIQPGTIKGRIRVSVDYVDGLGKHSVFMGTVRNSIEMANISYEILLK